MRSLLPIVFALLAALSPQKTGSAVDEFQRIRGELHASHVANDWKAGLASALAMKQFVNGAPDALLEVARAEAHVGDSRAALRELREYARMGQSTDLISTLPEFAALKTEDGFALVQSVMKANLGPVSVGQLAFELSDDALQPEDIDFDPEAKRFYITSVREKKIVSSDRDGHVKEFAKAPDGWPMMGVKVDAGRGVAWATEVAVNGFSAVAKADWGRSAVLCFELKSGKLLRRVEGPHGSGLGDMVLNRAGEPLVSDGDGGGVYRLAAGASALERVDAGDFVSPQTAGMAPDGKRAFVPDYVRGIGLLDLATKKVQWLAAEGKYALNGVDGLYFDHGKLIAVQNGTSPERVVAFTLDSSLTRIASETIFERSTATLGDPTHGVVVGQDFYYIANSGWDVVDEHGALKPGAKMSTPRVMRVRLG
jgi:sugar lactone lactonase YvrE